MKSIRPEILLLLNRKQSYHASVSHPQNVDGRKAFFR